LTQVPVQVPETTHTGDGVTASFLIGFDLPAGTGLYVTVADVPRTAGVHYNIVGSSVVFVTAPANGAGIAWRRATAIRQNREFPTQPTMKPLSVEEALNERARVDQDLAAQLGRGVSVPVGEAGLTLPRLSARNGRVAWFSGATMAAFQIPAGSVLGADPETGELVGVNPVFTVDSTPAYVASRAAAMFASFSPGLLFVNTAGYAAPGDGGGGLYKRVSAEPAHYGKFQDAAGQWFELATSEPNVLQFGALRDNNPASSAINALAFFRAAAMRDGISVFVPDGKYYCDPIGILQAAGISYRGAGRWRSIIKPGPTLTTQAQAIFYNSNAALGTAAYGSISEIGFELLGQDCTAINLDSVNNYIVRRCQATGGSSLGTAAGVLVRFDATRDEGSYSNRVQDCAGTFLYAVVTFGVGANHNTVDGGEAILCIKGYDVNPGEAGVDTPKLLNMRTEGCNIGIDDGATQGFYSGVRSENNQLCDFRFTSGTDHPTILGGFTAVTPNPVLGLEDADAGFSIQSDDLGWWESEPSLSRVRRYAMRQAFYAATQAPHTAPLLNGDWALYLGGSTVIRRNYTLEFVNGTDDNSLIALGTSSNTLQVMNYDRKNGGYGPIDIGGGSDVRPITDGVTNLGNASRRWGEVFAANATINTSDRRMKTDEAELDAAEIRVAQALRLLMRKFRWKDAKEAKGENARWHVGAMAQDVIAAFEAEGLDPFRYSMVCHDAWEAQPEQWSEPVMGEEPVLYEGGEPVLWQGGEIVRGPDMLPILIDGEEQRREAGEPRLDADGQPVVRQAGEPVRDARGRPVMRQVVLQERTLLRPASPAGERYSLRYEELLAFIIGGLV
jgi:hypothetical protein